MIIGGRVIEVKALKKKEDRIEGMNVGVNIDDVKIEKANDGKELVIVSYEHKTTYEPGAVEIIVRGELVADENEKARAEIAEEWKKKKFIPNEFAEDIINAITYTGTAVGTLLSFSLNIPAPLNLPRAKIGPHPEKKGKAG